MATDIFHKNRQGSLRLPPHNYPTKTEEIEVIESVGINGTAVQPETKRSIVGWICCGPCIWMRSSTTVQKFAITTATLIVTSLLVASPVLFLISTAPSQLPKNCNVQEDSNCFPAKPAITECNELECNKIAATIQHGINSNVDPCNDFQDYGCAFIGRDGNLLQSAQERVDNQMQKLLTANTTNGVFRNLGRLYGSCLRQQLNSSTIRHLVEDLGGYLPKTAMGPSSISQLLKRVSKLGPSPIIDMYFDLSYGKRAKVILIIDAPLASSNVLQKINEARFLKPKSPFPRGVIDIPKNLDVLLDWFLPAGLSLKQRSEERDLITRFIRELNVLKANFLKRDFIDVAMIDNVTALATAYPFINWTDLVPHDWSGPIIVRCDSYLRQLQIMLEKYHRRDTHNALLLVFVLGLLPQDLPNPATCTKATMWAQPDITSALYLTQFPKDVIQDAISRTKIIFQYLKNHLKREPSLKGKALVKLSALTLQANICPDFENLTEITRLLNEKEISSDNWIGNILNIHDVYDESARFNSTYSNHSTWAYPTISNIFYDSLSHSIVVPLSVVLGPFFNKKLPPYLHYASVGVAIAKEILRSITTKMEPKVIQCVPSIIDIYSNNSKPEFLIYSAGMQIAYHSMLTLAGPTKGMHRLPGIDLKPTQIFYIVAAQEFCANAEYDGIDMSSDQFNHVLSWLLAQGEKAIEQFRCPSGSLMHKQNACNLL